MMPGRPKTETKNTTATWQVAYTFDEVRWEKLRAFYKLPWYKRIFRKLP